VLRDRADGIADQVAFFTSLRGYGHPALRNAVRRTLPDVARRCDWTPDTSPSSRALLVSLPPLTPDDTLHIVGATCLDVPVPPQLPHATHRLTGGSPLGIALLAESAHQNLPEATTLGKLLTADVALLDDHDGRAAYQELLDRLAPGGGLDELTVLAAAHGPDSARVLAQAQLPDDFGASGVLDLEARLAEEGLPVAADQFVGDPFLRALLLLRLHHRDPGHEQWRAVHRTLIDHYDDVPGSDDSTGLAQYRLHHELALGKADSAVAHLRDTFHHLDTRAWLSALVFIASAPYFHAHDPDGHDFDGHDHRASVALGHTDAAQVPPDGVDAVLHLRVRRLLHAVWQLTDPLVLPDPKVTDRLRFELEQLSNLRPAGNALLWRASRDWPADALTGRPFRIPGDEDDEGEGG